MVVSALRLHSCTNTQENSRSCETLVPCIAGYYIAPGSANCNPSHLLQNRLIPIGQEHLPRGVNEGALLSSLVFWIVVLELAGAFYAVRESCNAIQNVVVKIARD